MANAPENKKPGWKQRLASAFETAKKTGKAV